MKYIYKIAIVFLLLLIVWHFIFNSSTTEYFTKQEQKALNAYQKYYDVLKTGKTKYKNSNNVPIKEMRKLQNKVHKYYKEANKYGKDFSPKQMEKINTELARRNPWASNLL